MSSLLTKPLVQHHLSRVRPIQLRDFPLSPLPFLWGTYLCLRCVALVRLCGLLVELLGLGSVASTEPRLLGTATVQQAWRSKRAELEARLLVTELLVAERCGLATTHPDSLAPPSEDPGMMNPVAFSCFALIYDDLGQPIPAQGIVAIGIAVANSGRCAVPQQAPRPAGVIVCFGTRGEEDILGNRWVHL